MSIRKYVKFSGEVYQTKQKVDKPVELLKLEQLLKDMKDARKAAHDDVDAMYDERVKLLKQDIKELKELTP